jgi:hypothetical protein
MALAYLVEPYFLGTIIPMAEAFVEFSEEND